MTHLMVKVTDFAIVGPYTLRIIFDDGAVQTINFEPVLYGYYYAPLRDPDFFRQVRLAQWRRLRSGHPVQLAPRGWSRIGATGGALAPGASWPCGAYLVTPASNRAGRTPTNCASADGVFQAGSGITLRGADPHPGTLTKLRYPQGQRSVRRVLLAAAGGGGSRWAFGGR